MENLISGPVFGVLLTLLAFEIGLFINRKLKLSFLNPLMLAVIFIIIILKITGISFEDYNNGARLISFFLAPTTVILAVPLYRKFKLLKQNAVPIITGIFVGSSVNIALIMILSNNLGLEKHIEYSLIPKSITTPIGINLSSQLGGIPEITVTTIIITGITGAIIGPTIFKILKIEDKVAKGIAFGTSSHAIGTAKAIEMGETEGAMSSLAIGITGLVTVVLAPIFVLFYG